MQSFSMAEGESRRWFFTWKAGEISIDDTMIAFQQSNCSYLVYNTRSSDWTTIGYAELSRPMSEKEVCAAIGPEATAISVSSDRVSQYISTVKGGRCGGNSAAIKWRNYYCEFPRENGETDWHEIMNFIKLRPKFEEFANEYPEIAIKYRKNIVAMLEA